MSYENGDKSWTKNLQNDTFTILREWGVRGLSVLCHPDSTTEGVFNGGSKLAAGENSEDITIPIGQAMNIAATSVGVLEGQIITSPDINCLLEITLLF